MRLFNFSAGPATLPFEVLEQAAEEMFEWRNSGMGVMEMSHRSKEYMEIHQKALDDIRELLGIPNNYSVLFAQGGAIAQNALIPLNLLHKRKNPCYAITGLWSTKSYEESKKYCIPHIAISNAIIGFRNIPPIKEWKIPPDSSYLHVCVNETINGVEMQEFPNLKGDIPLVADVTSYILSRPMDIKKYGVMYGSAQKNAGIAGLTIIIINNDLLDRSLGICPSAFNWKLMAFSNSMYNTPPTYAIYIAGLVFQWIKRQGGLIKIGFENKKKANLLYQAVDKGDFYINDIDPKVRSLTSIPFRLKDEKLNDLFLNGARDQGLLQLQGHRSVGGMRASIYNGMPIEGVHALIDYLRYFERKMG